MGELAMNKLTKQKADELIEWYFRDNYEESEMLLGLDLARTYPNLNHERAVKDTLFTGYNANQQTELITPTNNVNDQEKNKLSYLIDKYISKKVGRVGQKNY